MTEYLGIMVEQSFTDPDLMNRFQVLASRKVQSWTMHLVSVPEDQLGEQIRAVQAGMAEGRWYMHFFRGDVLVVVYKDAVFRVGTDPETWAPAAKHGLNGGIPREQLDFAPRMAEDAFAYFGVASRQ